MEGYVYIGMDFSVENIYIAMGLKQYYAIFDDFTLLLTSRVSVSLNSAYQQAPDMLL